MAKLADGVSCIAELPPLGMTNGCLGGAGGLYPCGTVRLVTPPAAEEMTSGMGGKGASSSVLAVGRRLAAYGSGEGDRSDVGCAGEEGEGRLLNWGDNDATLRTLSG